jgi:hypothetical protein
VVNRSPFEAWHMVDTTVKKVVAKDDVTLSVEDYAITGDLQYSAPLVRTRVTYCNKGVSSKSSSR